MKKLDGMAGTEANRWMKAEALKAFLSYMSHAKQHDCDLFAVATEYISPALWRRSLRDVFSDAELKAAQVDVAGANLRETLHGVVLNRATATKGRALVDAVVRTAIAKFEAAASETEPFRVRFKELVDALKLSPLESRILFVRSVGPLEEMFDATPHQRRGERRQDVLRDIAWALDVTPAELKGVLNVGSRLLRYGALDCDYDAVGRIRDFLSGFLDEPFASAYFDKDDVPAMPLDYFSEKLRADAERIRALVVSAKGRAPVNVLLYGEPGTGKTSLARTLAKMLGRDCYFIVQADMNRSGVYCRTPVEFRYGALRLCDEQVDPDRSLLVVDEADDLLNRHGDKGLLNAVLDQIRAPVVWITNTQADELDRSNRRRFDYSVRFNRPREAERLAIWRTCVRDQKASRLFPESLLAEFAARYEVSAGGIARVVANVVRQRPRTAAKAARLAEEYLAPHCELLGVKPDDEKLKPARDYSLEGLNIRGGVGLDDVLAAVRKFRATPAADSPDRPRMNILLTGAPGTGKTEWCKYLARELHQRLSVKMGSDLLGPFVGETEAKIRDAFREAEADDRILFFDEVDGIVNSRATATASWETTKVNEVLHQMENFDGVFIAATNYVKNLDEAVMRRFTFRLTFDWLAAEGKRHFWKVFFGTELSDAERDELDAIPQLTPADFRNVRQKFFYLDRPVSNAERLAALREEVAVKPRDTTEAHIGF